MIVARCVRTWHGPAKAWTRRRPALGGAAPWRPTRSTIREFANPVVALISVHTKLPSGSDLLSARRRPTTFASAPAPESFSARWVAPARHRLGRAVVAVRVAPAELAGWRHAQPERAAAGGVCLPNPVPLGLWLGVLDKFPSKLEDVPGRSHLEGLPVPASAQSPRGCSASVLRLQRLQHRDTACNSAGEESALQSVVGRSNARRLGTA